MARRKPQISAVTARRDIAEGKGVEIRSPKYWRILAGLWRQIVDQYVFVGTEGKWFDMRAGSSKPGFDEKALQFELDQRFFFPVPIYDFACASKLQASGNRTPQAKVSREAPQLRDLRDAVYVEQVERGLEKPAADPADYMLRRVAVKFTEFYPGRDQICHDDEGNLVWNLWVKPKAQVNEELKFEYPSWFLDPIKVNFYAPDDASPEEKEKHRKAMEYFLDWTAYTVCRPDVKKSVHVVISSKVNGTGKGFIAEGLKYLVGEKNYKIPTNQEIMKGDFNEFMEGASLAVIHELYAEKSYQLADKLKSLLSETTVRINKKGVSAFDMRNTCQFLAFSNAEIPLRVDENDRRWFMWRSSCTQAPPKDFWVDKWAVVGLGVDKTVQWDKLESLRLYLERRMKIIEETGRFNPNGPAMMTDYKQLIINANRSRFHRVLAEAMDERLIKLDDQRTASLGDIEETLRQRSDYQIGDVQKHADLRALGWTEVSQQYGSRWRAPDDYGRARFEPVGVVDL